MRPRRWRRPRRVLAALLLLPLLLLAAGALAYALTPLPSLSVAEAALPAPDTRILDRHGALIADLPRGGVRHETIPFSLFPLALRQATIAAEDASFYHNAGVDPLGILRAALLDARLDRAAYGGSTITQQLVRNLLLSPQERTSRSLFRKLHEAILALKLTRRLSKDDILALYLNNISYGNLTYGAEAASEFYFARPVGDLDLAQAALLAGLPRAPTLYDPLRHPDAAHRRALVVLDLMRQRGFISAARERLAAAERLTIGGSNSGSAATVDLAPHWVTYVLGQLTNGLGAERVARGGLTVRTTLDLGIQLDAQQAVQRRLAEVVKEHNAHDAAVVAISPHSGQVLAMVGSADPNDPSIDGAYNVALAPRQPGSAIKPFTYLAALDRWSPGARNLRLTAASILDDAPSTFYGPDGAPYQPLDYNMRFLGRVPLRVALGSSLNVPAVETLERVGIPRMLQVAHAAGITTMYQADRYGPALTLGGGEVTLLDLTSAYGTIAAGGVRHEPSAVLSVTDTAGHALGAWSPPPARQVLGPRGPQLAALMTDILADDSARWPEFGAGSVLTLPDRPAAVKTGTTTDWHDNWTVGYTPDLVTGVWVGNADNTPMLHILGITGAAPIWHDVMAAALRPVVPRPFALPPGMVRETVCQGTGLPPAPAAPCVDRTDALFIVGTQPGVGSGQWAVGSDEAQVITDPPNGARFGVSPDLPASVQQLSISAGSPLTPTPWLTSPPDPNRGSAGLARSPSRGEGSIAVLVDGRVVGTCSGAAEQPCSVLWQLRPGKHYLQACGGTLTPTPSPVRGRGEPAAVLGVGEVGGEGGKGAGIVPTRSAGVLVGKGLPAVTSEAANPSQATSAGWKPALPASTSSSLLPPSQVSAPYSPLPRTGEGAGVRVAPRTGEPVGLSAPQSRETNPHGAGVRVSCAGPRVWITVTAASN